MATTDNTIACYALTSQGVELLRRLAPLLGAEVFVPQRWAKNSEQGFSQLAQTVTRTFHQYKAHIFVTAAGIAVRSIAPCISHKSTDPAVVVCDQKGQHAISLLSGHWGGGNALAQQVAQLMGGTAVITTATDTEDLPSMDTIAQQAGCTILDWDKVKSINAALLAGEKVQIYDPLQVLLTEHRTCFVPVKPHHVDTSLPTVAAHWRHVDPGQNLLRLAVPALHVGIGCRQQVPAAAILEAVHSTLQNAGLEPLAINCIASVTAKQDEAGLKEAAEHLHVPLVFYSPEELSDAPAPTPSAMAAQIFGVEHISVCEGAALLSAGGEDATLLVPKIKYDSCITVAVALHENMVDSDDL